MRSAASRAALASALVALAWLGATAAGPATPTAGQHIATVIVGDYFFCHPDSGPGECVTTVAAGDTVVWTYPAGIEGHTVTHCGESCEHPTDSPLFDSGTLKPAETFTFAFDTPGTYLYRCDFHPQAMVATIVVPGPGTPTPEPSAPGRPVAILTAFPTPKVTVTPASTSTEQPGEQPTRTATATRTPTATGTPTPSPTPASGRASGEDGGLSPWWFVLGGVGATLALLGGTAAVRRVRHG